jgi:YaiO family outer membrane protein
LKKIIFISCLIIVIRLSTACLAETTESIPNTSIQTPTLSPTPSSVNSASAPAETKKTIHLEMGGSYSNLNNNYGQWKSLDFRVQYSGLKKITPSCSVSRLTRKEGSQFVYGFGSYITINPKFYMAAGISGAPVKKTGLVLYPRLRLDIGGFYSQSLIKGLVLTTGLTHFPKQNGNGGDIISIGGIYYGKIIFTGAVSYNIAQPGHITSWSEAGSFMYGTQGKYWFGGSATMGRAAYQLATEIPLDVRYNTRGGNLFYSRWLGKDWGINTRVDYGNMVGFYKLIGVTSSLFFDF